MLRLQHFLPLIYDLKQDVNQDKLLNQLKIDHQNFIKNPSLPEKIRSISTQKSWPEDIKDSKGNTEANSIRQALRINQTWVYDFGLKEGKKITSLKIDDVIWLRVPKNVTGPEKIYSFSQPVDLHDKLTLVAGREKQQQNLIRYFEDIFEGIMNMGHIYIDLLRNGNILFKNWTATMYCSKESVKTMKVNFGIDCDRQNVFAERKFELDTVSSINKTLKFLKECYDGTCRGQEVDLKRA